MKIEKINENQIRCTLTKQDLATRKIKLSELSYGSTAVRKLFKDMMKQAYMEFGFEAENVPLMIEAIPTSDETIILNVTKVEEPDELDLRYSRFTQTKKDNEVESMESLRADSILNAIKKLGEDLDNADSEDDDETVSKSSDKKDNFTQVYKFENLRDLCDAVSIIAPVFKGKSKLYYNDGKYLLSLEKGSTEDINYNKICNILNEYSDSITKGSLIVASINELVKPVIDENAVEGIMEIAKGLK